MFSLFLFFRADPIVLVVAGYNRPHRQSLGDLDVVLQLRLSPEILGAEAPLGLQTRSGHYLFAFRI
jgi:hypothetical protein